METIRRTLSDKQVMTERRPIASARGWLRLQARSINRSYYNLTCGTEYNERGINIFKQDWDNLIILDVCRYDLFQSRWEIAGKLDDRISRGSSTIEFLKGNFNATNRFDKVYVTANPQYEHNRTDLRTDFHEVINVWDSDRWNESLGTVPPEEMTSAVRETVKNFPEKRIIAHYLQPHYPFIGYDGFDSNPTIQDVEGASFWHRIANGELSIAVSEIWEAYSNTFDLTISPIRALLSDLPGKTVITSDHGNMIADQSYPLPTKEWGHPTGIYTPVLVKVPWHVVKNGVRKTITTDRPHQRSEDVSAAAKDRLQELGYRM